MMTEPVAQLSRSRPASLRLLVLLLLLLVLAPVQWAVAGVRIGLETETATHLSDMAAMEGRSWAEERARAIARQARLAGDLRQSEAAIAANERTLRGLLASFAELDEAKRGLELRQATAVAELTLRRQRLEAILAEIVQLSRDTSPEPRRLAQLRALAGSLADPFAEAEALLAEATGQLHALEERASRLRDRSLAARQARVVLLAREQHLLKLAEDNRQMATVLATRASAADRMAELMRSRAELADAASAVSAARLQGHLAASPTAGAEWVRPRAIGRDALTARASSIEPLTRAAAQVDVPDAVSYGMPEGQLAPVSGAVLSRFGEGQEPPFDRGVTIEVDDRRLVRAPRDGRVVFARAYPGFGLLLIIDHGNEYHSLLSGLSRFVVNEGWTVRAGQMVGTLEPESKRTGKLYVELRRRGIPVDPLAWFAAGQDKVRS